jgi:NADH:ubiquinone oxidoreductase subunit E
MENEKVEIMICLGSSCFARGNKHTVKVIKQYLSDHKLEANVHYHGNHCFGKCDKGPFVKINDQLYEGVQADTIELILNKVFFKKG